MDTLLDHAMRTLHDGRLPPHKPPSKPVKLGAGGDRKPAHALKPVSPSPVAPVTVDCPAQSGRPDFADDIDRIVQTLLADGDVRWSETQGYHAPRRSWRYPAVEDQI